MSAKQSTEARVPAARILLSKCCKHNKMFGIRVERAGNDWIRTWAFPISAASAKREGFDETMITGSLNASPEFPGCPHCGAKNLFKCACGQISCYDGQSRSVFCYWCNTKADDLVRSTSFDVGAGAL